MAKTAPELQTLKVLSTSVVIVRVMKMPWPKNRRNKLSCSLRLSDKDHAIKGLIICYKWDVSAIGIKDRIKWVAHLISLVLVDSNKSSGKHGSKNHFIRKKYFCHWWSCYLISSNTKKNEEAQKSYIAKKSN